MVDHRDHVEVVSITDGFIREGVGHVFPDTDSPAHTVDQFGSVEYRVNDAVAVLFSTAGGWLVAPPMVSSSCSGNQGDIGGSCGSLRSGSSLELVESCGRDCAVANR